MTESDILSRILPTLQQSADVIVGPGDDAAVCAWDEDTLVVSTDMLVEGHDFTLDWSNAHEIGRKAMAQNLADIAAMGARPTHVVVATAAPQSTTVDWLAELSRGMQEYCARWGVSIIGGDLSAAPQVVISVAAHGTLDGRAAVTRAGANPGDIVAIAGPAGVSGAGLALLESGVAGADAKVPAELEALVGQVINWHCAPEPQIALGAIAAEAGATAMIDTSDGLWEDGSRIAMASSRRLGTPLLLNLFTSALDHDARALAPLAQALRVNPYDWVLGGGEDHSLLATFPAGLSLPAGFREIGQVLAVQPQDVPAYQALDLPMLLDSSPRDVRVFDHFGG
ncbi:thiamine-phosphate kinase [Micrococcales bacterium 31B]|nr:thiamine-phosphate kinase [Micrococcales bacterium 31B]